MPEAIDPTYARWRDEFGVYIEQSAEMVRECNHVSTLYARGQLTDMRGIATATMIFKGIDDNLTAIEGLSRIIAKGKGKR